MSLHKLATHMQSQGRNGDTGLIHMSPAEINGLQHLAIAHGGSLTINPKTGLPEASFLKDWLPSIVGGLAILAAPFTGGMSLMGAAALGGGLAFGTSMAVGNSFKKSLFTGLMTGAGGAATAGLGGAGAATANVAKSAIAPTVSGAALRTVPQIAGAELGAVGSTALSQGAMRGAGVGAAESVGSTLSAAAPRVFSAEAQQLAQQGAQRGLTQEAGMLAQPGRIFAGAAPRQGVTTYTGTAGQTITPEQFGASRLTQARPTPYTAKPIEPLPANYGPSSYGGTQAPAPISDISSVASGADKYANMSMGDRFVAQGEGVKNLFTEPGAASAYLSANKGSLALTGIGAIGSSMSDPEGIAPPPAQKSDYAGPYLPTERTAQFPIGPQPWTDTSERQYFNSVNPYPGYIAYDPKNKTPISAATGGLMGLAGGGGSYDDESGYDSYAEGGEVEKKMATPDMSAIQQYVQSISPQQGTSALQNYVQNIGSAQTTSKPQVPEILRQLQAQQAPQGEAQTSTGERDYGIKPITVQVLPPKPTAGTADKTGVPANGIQLALSGGGKGGASGAQPAPVDPYAAYRPKTIDTTAPGATTKTTTQYTDLNNRVYNPETQQMEVPMAMGGLTSLARGGSYLDGPGDGLSDSIPAMIGKNQPARLADGEFVISADVVSAIGGGSSKAGAKKLHSMMDRVRQSAHGTKKQVRKINDRKVLAA